MQDATQTPQTWGHHIRTSAVLAVPLVGSHLTQMLTHTTDVVMMGWYSVEGLAGVVLATSMFFVIFIVGSGFAFAVMPMAATALGADEPAQVRRSVRMGAWLVTIYGVAVMVPLLSASSILQLLGQDPVLSGIAGDYMKIAAWGIFPGLLIMLFKSFFSALERAEVVLWATVIGALANVLFNYVFIFGNFGAPEMGARGAALASVLTTSLSCLFLLLYAAYVPAFKEFQLFRKPLRPDWAAFFDVFRLGYPIGLTMLAEAGLFSATAVMVGWFGTVPLAAHGVVIQLASLAFMIPLGFSNVATIRVGRAYGRGDPQGQWRASVVVMTFALAVATVSMLIMISIPSQLVSLFISDTEADFEAIVAVGSVLVLVAAAFQIVDSAQVVALGLLRGIKDTAVPMVIAVVAYWVLGLPIGYYLAFNLDFGAKGVWLGLVIGLGVAAVLLMWRYLVMYGRIVQKALVK